ncbi:MAG: hypothetical protein JZD41_07715 [Thermoproteus sp.]|nr:hypothetical protein [Thermoproteus sp.]
MDLLNRLGQSTVAGVEIGAFKIGLDALVAYTPAYKIVSYLKQGGEFVLGVAIAFVLDLVLDRVWPAAEKYAVARLFYLASFVSLFEQIIPISAKPLYLNTSTMTLEGYHGTVKAAFMINSGNVYPINVSTPAVGLTSSVTTYVVVTTDGVYVTTAPYMLQYSPMPTPLKL